MTQANNVAIESSQINSSGVLTVPGGGTGLSTVGTNGQVLTSNGTTLSWTSPAAATTFSAGTTGFTPNTATSGNVTLGGTLNVANGGTGVTTSTGSGSVVLNNNSTFTGTITMPSSVSGLLLPAFSTTNQGSNQAPLWFTRTSSQYTGISFRGVSAADYGIYNKAGDDSLYAGYWGGSGAWTDTLKLDTSKNATFYGTLYNANARPMLNQTGGILQVVSTNVTGTVTTSIPSGGNPGTFYAISGFSVSITPSSTSSKILIIIQGCGSSPSYSALFALQLRRSGTTIGASSGSGYNTASVGEQRASLDANSQNNFSWHYVDSPATTSAITYQVYVTNENSSSFVLNNSGGQSSGSVFSALSASNITAMEIAG